MSPCVHATQPSRLVEQLAAPRAARALGEPLVELDRHAEGRRERLDRLDAAHVGARHHARDAAAEQRRERQRLFAAAPVERAQPVVAAQSSRSPADACRRRTIVTAASSSATSRS